MSAEPSLFASRAARVALVMSCLFSVAGIILPYLPRWLEDERGLSGEQIGAILSLAQLTRIVTGPLVALWADGAPDRSAPIRILAIAAIAAYAAFFFLAHDFWSLLVLCFVALTLTQSMTPFVEAATLRATMEGKISYGVARALGSISFIIANVAGGFLIARFGPEAVVIWTISALVALALSAWLRLQPDPAPHEAHAGGLNARLAAASALLRTRRFLIVVVSCGLIQSAHAFYYGFSVLAWREQGVAESSFGSLWAFAVGVEVLFLWFLPVFERRASPEVLILLGAAGAVVRWTFMGFAPTGFLLWPLQALHVLSFAAAHVGAMRLIYREAPPAAAGIAQTVYSGLSAGLLMGLATLLSGFLYDAVGARGYWAMAGIALAGGALALLLLQPAPRRPTASEP